MTPRAALGSLAAALLATGCASPQGIAPRAALQEPNRLAAERSLADARLSPAAWPREDWWRAFGDPQLDRLVAEALAHSPGLRIARARVDRALALARVAGAPLGPQVGARADATRERFTRNSIYPPQFGGRWFWQNQALLDFSYEFDFWGRNAEVYAAALGEARAVEADAYAARLVLATALTRAYIRLAAAHDQAGLARETLAERRELVALVRRRVAAGLDSQVELKQAEAAIPEAEQRIAQLDEQIALTRNQIAALAGAGPDRGLALAPPRLAPAAGLALPSRLPADLIGRRPDVVANRWRVEAASHAVAAARAQFYPNLDLVAYAGLQSLGWSRFLEAGSVAAGVGPALRLPIFDAGRLRGNLASRSSEYDLAVEQYNQTLGDALREVADQVTTLRAVARERPQLAAGLATAREALALARTRYAAGLGNHLTVVAAESQLVAQRSLAAELDRRAREAAADLAHALGGGYAALGER
jgi:NodT family efflux transporter outer membrane factor (OMF) lipoprotein